MAKLERRDSMVPCEGAMTKGAQFRIVGEIDADLRATLTGIGFSPAADGGAYLEKWVKGLDALKMATAALRPLVAAGKLTI